MTKTELQTALATATNTDKRTAGAFLETLSSLAYKEIKKNGEFVLPGFGKLVKQKRKARTGINPKTLQKIKIPAKTVVNVGTGSKSLVLHDIFIPEHRCVMVSDLFAGTPPGALVHPEYPVLRAPRGFLVSYSLPPVAVALGLRALDIACATLATRVSRGVTRVAESEVVQMAIGEAAAAIDAATLLLHTGRDHSTAEVSSGRQITEAEALRARRDMVYAQHQVSWAVDRLCEMDGARWVYDNDRLGAIRRDVMTILTHHAASRQAAMAPYGRMLLASGAG